MGEEKIKIVGINGSPLGTASTTWEVMSRALKGAKAVGAETIIIDLVDVMPDQRFDGRRNQPVCEDFKPLLDMVKTADGLIIGSPVVWGGPTPHVVDFLAYLTPTCDAADYPLMGMPIVLFAVYDEDGAQATINTMAAALCKMGCVIAPFGMHWYNKNIAALSERGWQETDVPILGRRIVLAAEVFKPHRCHDWDHMPALVHDHK